MLFALVNSTKTAASPGLSGVCPLCERRVNARCGEINIWHWAHRKNEDCDSWYEPETAWHQNWKLVFGKEHCEQVITKNNVRHIADIFTNNQVVIELQNSPIQIKVVRKREDFYGERMLWIINGEEFKHNFSIIEIRPEDEYDEFDDALFEEIGDEMVDRTTGEIFPNTRKPKELVFSWNWPRKTWMDVQMPVFIDFGCANLYRVMEGMGAREGKLKKVNKEDFLKKYGGNIELLPTLINGE